MTLQPHKEPGCVFCDIDKIATENGKIEHFTCDGVSIMAFTPLHPVTPGHTLVVPVTHVNDARKEPKVSGATMRAAAFVARRFHAFNIITSGGAEATQTVFHMHLHVVPRMKGDGLVLPWGKATA